MSPISLICLDRRVEILYHANATIAAKTAAPPTTPPTIGPMGVELDEEVCVAVGVGL